MSTPGRRGAAKTRPASFMTGSEAGLLQTVSTLSKAGFTSMGPTSRGEHQQHSALREAIARLCQPPLTRHGLVSGLCLAAWLPMAASALSLGELNVQSRLGQPLNASVPVRLAPGETLAPECVTQSFGSGGLPAVPGLRVNTPRVNQPGNYQLQLSSPRALTEPLYGIQLRVACPGTPVMVRQFVLMVDPPGAATGPAAVSGALESGATTQAPAARQSPPTVTAAAPAAPQRATPAPTRERTPVSAGSSYQVQPGDTLSGIAGRVSERNGRSLWQMADLIFSANPDAFIGGNPDRLRAGSELFIPMAGQPVTRTATPEPVPAAAPPELPPRLAVPMVRLEEPVARPAPAIQATSPPETAAPLTPPGGAERVSGPVAATAPIELPPRQGVSPALATAAGLLLGLVLSLLLGRFGLGGPRREPEGGRQAAPEAAPVPESLALPAAQTVPRANPGMEVTEGPLPALAVADTSARARAPVAAAEEDITNELSALFGVEDDTRDMPQPAGRQDTAELPALEAVFGSDGEATTGTATMAAIHVPGSSSREEPTVENPLLPQREISADAGSTIGDLEDDELPVVDEEASGIDWPLEDTVRETVVVAEAVPDKAATAVADTGSSLDLQSLAASADSDDSLSDSLIEALRLLEQDYQQELTSTQLASEVAEADLRIESAASRASASADAGDQRDQAQEEGAEAESVAPTGRHRIAS